MYMNKVPINKKNDSNIIVIQKCQPSQKQLNGYLNNQLRPVVPRLPNQKSDWNNACLGLNCIVSASAFQNADIYNVANIK